MSELGLSLLFVFAVFALPLLFVVGLFLILAAASAAAAPLIAGGGQGVTLHGDPRFTGVNGLAIVGCFAHSGQEERVERPLST